MSLWMKVLTPSTERIKEASTVENEQVHLSACKDRKMDSGRNELPLLGLFDSRKNLLASSALNVKS